MVLRVKAANIRKATQEPVSHSASRDSCCPGDCDCSINYGCKCEHDCTCPDRSLAGGEIHELVLTNEYLTKLKGNVGTQGSGATAFTRGDSDMPSSIPVSDEELYDAGDMEPVKDTLLGDNPTHGSLYNR